MAYPLHNEQLGVVVDLGSSYYFCPSFEWNFDHFSGRLVLYEEFKKLPNFNGRKTAEKSVPILPVKSGLDFWKILST